MRSSSLVDDIELVNSFSGGRGCNGGGKEGFPHPPSWCLLPTPFSWCVCVSDRRQLPSAWHNTSGESSVCFTFSFSQSLVPPSTPSLFSNSPSNLRPLAWIFHPPPPLKRSLSVDGFDGCCSDGL